MCDRSDRLLGCPNPWCDQGELRIRDTGDRLHRIARVSVYCAACETAGPVRASREAAIAAWNTRKGAESEDAIGAAWNDAALPAPEGKPVMALYRAWNRTDGPLMKHVVWWREGGWRIYPFTTNQGFVERWRELAVAS